MRLWIFALWLFSGSAVGAVVEYTLDIAYGTLNVSGQQASAMLVNGSYPGPVLRFQEGDTARIRVTNFMDVDSSIHWHGLLVPPSEDGVPYLSNFPIGPGETYVYEFALRHAGTYWYHSHTDLQEQSGVHGGIVVTPRELDRPENREAVVVLQDWTDEQPHQVLANLKKDGDFYALKKGSVISLAGYLERNALANWWQSRWTRMGGMDVSDVAYDAFLANGEKALHLFPDARAGEQVRLRLINAGASTYFLLHGSDLPLKVVAADGLDVRPVSVDEIMHAVAETYDVLITVPDSGAVELRASAQDGSGFASIIVGAGSVRKAVAMQPPDLYASHASHAGPAMSGAHAHHQHGAAARRLDYDDLRTTQASRYAGQGELRVINLRLTGDMQTYNWSFNDVPLSRADKILVERGETVRFHFINETMMHHPMHLHGHFFRVLTDGPDGPMKHTVDVPPMSTVTIEFLANEEKDWFFHCHNLYHAKTGMARVVRYSDYDGDPALMAAKKRSQDIRDDDFYYAGEIKLFNDLAILEAWHANAKHRLEASLESFDYDEERVDLAYLYRLDRWSELFAGVEKETDEDTQFRLGVRYVLPLLVDMELFVSDEGDVDVGLETELQLTTRAQSHWQWQSTGEYHFGLEYRVTEQLSLEAAYTDTVDASLGVKWRF